MTTLLPQTAISGAITQPQTTSPLQFRDGIPKNLTIQANFAYGSGGATVDAYVQTSVDGGTTWFDIAQFHFTTAAAIKLFNLSSTTPVTTQGTAGDGVLTANTAVDGLIGAQLRVKYKSSGTYAGNTSLQIDVSTARLQTLS